jgi:NIMA-interacting peptidyl-prolyl cis-trans isomerase 1
MPYFFNPVTKESTWVAPETLSEEEIKRLLSEVIGAGDHPEECGAPGGRKQTGDRPERNEAGGRREQTGDRPKGSEAADGQERARARHLLVKHRGSRRPSSWKQVNVMLFISSHQPIISC